MIRMSDSKPMAKAVSTREAIKTIVEEMEFELLQIEVTISELEELIEKEAK